jgi:hypothetical protein
MIDHGEVTVKRSDSRGMVRFGTVPGPSTGALQGPRCIVAPL